MDLGELLGREPPDWGSYQCVATTRKGRPCERFAVVRGLVCTQHCSKGWDFGDWLAIYAYGQHHQGLPRMSAVVLKCRLRWPHPEVYYCTPETLTMAGDDMTRVSKRLAPFATGEPIVQVHLGGHAYGCTRIVVRASATISTAQVLVDQALARGRLSEANGGRKAIQRFDALVKDAEQIEDRRRAGRSLAGLRFAPLCYGSS